MFTSFKLWFCLLWQNWRSTSPSRSIQVNFCILAGAVAYAEEALSILALARRRHPFELHLIDVDQVPDLLPKYGMRVPVVVVNGRERFHGKINRVLLERLLAAESAQG